MINATSNKDAKRTVLYVILGILLLGILVIGVLFLLHILRITSSPAIEIIAPVEGQSVPALTPVVVQAAALQRKTPVSRLDFYADGILYGSISGATDSLIGSWNWVPSSGGSHELAFVAINTKGVMNLVRRNISISEVADTDGDGIPDSTDACPVEYGYAASTGCLDGMDADADGLAGDADACPEVYGSAADGGCTPETRPDADGDGMLDSADRCPEVSGMAEFAGCPIDSWFIDVDGDTIPDFIDHCPDLAGSAEASGCPEAGADDSDGDGISESEDACPDEPGGAGTAGCPLAESDDSDGDGVADSADACPDEAGVGSADGCLPEDWTTDADLDFIPDLFDHSPDLPGLFDLLGMPLPEDEDADGSTITEDRCPGLVGSPADGGCPRVELPVDSYRLQNLFRLFPGSPLETPVEPEGVVISSIVEAWPNDVDMDGVDDSLDDDCVGEDGEPDSNGCAPEGDNDRDGIPNSIDRCDDVPGLYWGEYTDSYMFGCPRDPVGKVNLELEITAVRIADEMHAVYCFADPHPFTTTVEVDRFPPAYRYYSTALVSGYGYYLRLSSYLPHASATNIDETRSINLYLTCWGQPEGISLPPRYLGEIYRKVEVEDWDSQIRYAAGIGDGQLLEVFYRICRDHCP